MIAAGITLNAAAALPRQQTFSRAQVAYLIELAYRTGLTARRAYDIGELHASWAEHHTDPPTRADRVAAEIAAAGPCRYLGGPVDWDSGKPCQVAA